MRCCAWKRHDHEPATYAVQPPWVDEHRTGRVRASRTEGRSQRSSVARVRGADGLVTRTVDEIRTLAFYRSSRARCLPRHAGQRVRGHHIICRSVLDIALIRIVQGVVEALYGRRHLLFRPFGSQALRGRHSCERLLARWKGQDHCPLPERPHPDRIARKSA